MPPNGYQRSFYASAQYHVFSDDLLVPPSIIERSYEFEIALRGADRYSTQIGPCLVDLTVSAVNPEGVAHLSTSPFPLVCSFETTTGAIFEVEFDETRIEWGQTSFEAYMDGTYVSRLAGRPDETGTYTVFVDGY